MRLSVVVVNYNTGDYLERCLDSVTEEFVGIDYELLVVDNASSDGSFDTAYNRPHVSLLKNGRNIGFAAACNIGADKASGDMLLFLNPDTRILSDNIDELLKNFEKNRRAGALGCRNRLPGGEVQSSAYRFPTLLQVTAYVFRLKRLLPFLPLRRIFSIFLKKRFGQFHPHDETMTVDYVTGAFLLVKRNVWLRVGGFDEKFFLFCEEIDWCKRLHELGGEVLFEPSFEIEHYVGLSSEKEKPRVMLEKFKSYLVYFKKHNGGFEVACLKRIFAAGIFFWMALHRLTGNRDSYDAYKKLRRELPL